ncbi:hypothetical protein M1446_05390 [Candidatus Dependentiae bacterium]|nr:hypothetical protein [Candidatus Dependentiae bacterium]
MKIKLLFLISFSFLCKNLKCATVVNDTNKDIIIQIKQGPLPVNIDIRRMYEEGNNLYSNTIILPARNNPQHLPNSVEIGNVFILPSRTPFAIFVWDNSPGTPLLKTYDNTVGGWYIPSNYIHFSADRWVLVHNTDPKKRGEFTLIFPR